jgi:hypothetical protein
MSERVAIVAVHGVAYHEPGASANAMSELLLGLPEERGAKYGPFAAETVHIPLHPLKIEQPPEPGEVGAVQKMFEPLEERTSLLTREWKTSKKNKETNADVADDFMRLTMRDYRGARDNNPKDARDATAYITTRLRTTRGLSKPGNVASQVGGQSVKNAGGVGNDQIGVDVYEMYWADLARPKNTILSFFQALYQLLFHLASLSRVAINTGYLENREQRQWNWLERSQTYAVRMLTLPIPILNILLLATLFGVAPRLINGLDGEDPAPWAAAIGALILGLLGYAFASPSFDAKSSPLKWTLYPLVVAVPLAGIAYWAAHLDSRHIVLATEGLLVGSMILYFSMNSYDEVRDGAKKSAFWLWVLWVGAVVWSWTFGHADSSQQATLWTVQYVLAALRFSWFLFFVFSFAAWALGESAWRGINATIDKKRRARAKAAVRTSRFALAMPTLGILIVTLALWSALFIRTGVKNGDYGNSIAVHLFGDCIEGLRSGPPGLHSFFVDGANVNQYLDPPHDGPLRPNDYFQALLVWSATPGFPLVLLLIFLGLFLLILWALPSVGTEAGKNSPARSTDNLSRRMGAWLSRGLDSTKIVVGLNWWAAFVVPAVFGLFYGFVSLERLQRLQGVMQAVNQFFIGGSAVILEYMGLAAGSVAILTALAGSGSSVLGIILDVDNYLRTSPAEETPRARIMERYVSLLRYLAEYRDPKDGKPYDRVVIVAHSLGALISCDLLRFLKVQPDSPKFPTLRLFTMGNPLRQLLNRFFPYLYEWVNPLPDNSLNPLGKIAQTKPVIRPNQLPDPIQLGVECWLSAYRSGDYVGRSLWLDEWYGRDKPVAPVASGTLAPPLREEICIGAGAHQHYWDQSAPDIAEKLDDLMK